ncbi:CRISPR_Cas6 domain-containing protein [Gammaproteobacteria bacterium]
MLDFINPIALIRYLIVWRVTSPIVLLPRCFPIELTMILGKLIENNLPSQQSREWRKTLTNQTPRWPVETVIFFPYLSGKRAYGKGELIIWELKLIGESADHGLFLELILPAMEKAATIRDHALRGRRNLWSRFDIQAIYVARGRMWEPLVDKGKLNTDYRPTPTQWMDGLTLGESTRRGYRYFHWITPFEFISNHENDPAAGVGPSLKNIFNALMTRMTIFLPGKNESQRIQEVWALLSPTEQSKIEWALQQEGSQPLVQQEALQSPPKEWPGQKIGVQAFQDITPSLFPYLELASILHIGEHVRLGCGTFVLT